MGRKKKHCRGGVQGFTSKLLTRRGRDPRRPPEGAGALGAGRGQQVGPAREEACKCKRALSHRGRERKQEMHYLLYDPFYFCPREPRIFFAPAECKFAKVIVGRRAKAITARGGYDM